MDVVAWAKSHPAPAVAIGGGIFLLFLFLFSRGSSSGGGDGTALDQAYFAAQSAQAQSADAVQIATVNAYAGVAQTQIAADASTKNNTTWANANVTMNASNNAVAPVIAKYQADAVTQAAQTQAAASVFSSGSAAILQAQQGKHWVGTSLYDIQQSMNAALTGIYASH